MQLESKKNLCDKVDASSINRFTFSTEKQRGQVCSFHTSYSEPDVLNDLIWAQNVLIRY